jgi:hypothetical protein
MGNRLIVKIIRPLSHDAASDKSLQRTKSISIVWCHKADGIPDRLCPSGPPDAVNIIFRVHGKIKIHNVRYAIHIDPSCRNIGGDEHAHISGFKGSQGVEALILGTIRMEGGRGNLRSCQTLGDSIGAVFCSRENEH